jgi:hypothetical protein
VVGQLRGSPRELSKIGRRLQTAEKHSSQHHSKKNETHGFSAGDFCNTFAKAPDNNSDQKCGSLGIFFLTLLQKQRMRTQTKIAIVGELLGHWLDQTFE